MSYRVGVIGRTGRGDYGHGLDVVWNDIDEARVIAVADENPEGRKAAAKRLSAERAYADYREMLDKERLHIVSVAPRWIDCHRDMVVACAEYGAHIFLEKPMCRTLNEADEMISACEQAQVKMVIAHQTRYSPRLARVQELIEEGRLGDLLELRGRGKEDHRGGGEDLMVLGTHIMDLMRFLAGNPGHCFAEVYDQGELVSREQVREGAEGIGPLAGDEIHTVYRFQRPTMGYFSTVRARHGASKRFGLQIYGTKGVLTTTTGSLPRVHFFDDPSWSLRSRQFPIEITSAGLGKPEPLQDQGLHLGNVLAVKDLIECIGSHRAPRSNMYDARAALEMIMAVYESHRQRTSVNLPLQNREHPLEML